ncbi:G patch domain-containing protein 11 [Rhizophlyctis rosea]|nr:G patch domain-containing protein 11 [Rhizophlyctis rosea]
MSSEEEDYMSEAILAGLSATHSKPKTYSERRKQELQRQKERGYNKPKAEAEREAREVGLATQISEDNKGFKMLAKMGYRKGAPLGPSTDPSSPSTALKAPIQVALKSDRHGIGIPDEATITRKRTKEEEEQREKEREAEKDDYRTKMNRQFEDKRVIRDVKTSRIVCEQMDLAKGWERNEFWISKPPQKEKEGTPAKEGREVDAEDMEEYAKEEVDVDSDDEGTDGVEKETEFQLMEVGADKT